jgi:hypothetical protein
MVENHVLIPTMVESTLEQKGCQPSSANGYSCDDEYKIGDATTQSALVADIERYTIHVSHAYTRLAARGDGADAPGFYLECDKSGKGGGIDLVTSMYGTGELECDGEVLTKEIQCLHHDCPFLHEDASLLQKTSKRASSWIWRSRQLGASLLTGAAEILYPARQSGEEPAAHGSRANHSRAHEAHGHIHSRKHRHHQKLMRTPYSIDAKGTIHANVVGDDDASQSYANQPLNGEVLEQKREIEGQHSSVRDGGVWGERAGDVFTIEKLLQLADSSLDGTVLQDGKPLRHAGSVIEIETYYTNLHPWSSSFGNMDVKYEYRVTRRPFEEMRSTLFSQYQPDFPAKRNIEERHGIYVIVKISGEFGSFSLLYFAVLLASAAGLMRAAVVIVDWIATHVMKMKEVYIDAKYQYTERVWEMEKDLDAMAAMRTMPSDSSGAGTPLLQETQERQESAERRFSSGDAGAGGTADF